MKISRVYALFLRLYPRPWRESFTEEMLGVFEQAVEEHRSARGAAFARFIAAEFLGVLAGAVVERVRGAPEQQPAASGAEARISKLTEQTVHAIATHDFETARRCASEEERERARLRELRAQHGTDDN
jgi:hypothetical protein